VLDLFTRKIVGWCMRPNLHVEIALDALQMAIQRQRPAPGLIHHSDRGIQYAAEAYRGALARAGITPSMSRKGDCWDNAPMESFFHTLKTERGAPDISFQPRSNPTASGGLRLRGAGRIRPLPEAPTRPGAPVMRTRPGLPLCEDL